MILLHRQRRKQEHRSIAAVHTRAWAQTVIPAVLVQPGGIANSGPYLLCKVLVSKVLEGVRRC